MTEMMTMTTGDACEVYDGERIIRFNGKLLAEATSDDGRKLRWTEVKIFKTDAGLYVTSRVGRSLVFHAANGCSFGVWGTATEDMIQCPVCLPKKLTHVKVEQTRQWAQVSELARGVVEGLTEIDSDSVRYIPRVSQLAMVRAGRVDEGIRDAFLVTHIP